MTHIEPYAVSYTTYNNHGCRCDGCQRAHSDFMREYRNTGRGRLSSQVRSRAQSSALAWVRNTHPDIWKGILDAEWDKVGGRGDTGPMGPR